MGRAAFCRTALESWVRFVLCAACRKPSGGRGDSIAINGFSTLACLWQFPLLTAGMLAGLVLLFLLVLFVSTLFVDPKKLVEKPSAYFRFMLNQFCRLALSSAGCASM